MVKSLLFSSLLAACLLFAASSRGDITPTQVVSPTSAPAPAAAPEPITGMPAETAPGSESPPLDPFKPYDVGPSPLDDSPKPLWSYSDLTAAEQAQLDTGRDVTGWSQVHSAFNTASAELARRAAASSAAAQLGAPPHLATIGVVP